MKDLSLLLALWAAVSFGCQDRQASDSALAGNTIALNRVYNVEKGIVPPELTPLQVNLDSDQSCKNRGRGTVVLSFVIDSTGVARDLGFEHSTGTPLDGIAHKIVAADRFKPASLDGTPVAVSEKDEITLDGCFSEVKDAKNHTVLTAKILAPPEQHIAPFKMRPEDLEYALTELTTEHPGNAQTGSVIEHVDPRAGVTAPVVLNNVDATYSDEARRKKINAAVVAKIVVDPLGLPRCARIVKPTGFGLDEQALEAVRKYRFKPAMKNGVPVAVMITIEVVFRLT